MNLRGHLVDRGGAEHLVERIEPAQPVRESPKDRAERCGIDIPARHDADDLPAGEP